MYRNIKFVLLVVSITLGLTAQALAGQGKDMPAGMKHEMKPEMKHECAMQGGCQGMPYCLKGLSDDDMKKVQEKSKAYLEQTDGLRKDIQKQMTALKEELAKKDPDQKAAVKLQKEISGLEAKLDVKRVKHFMEIKKINPDIRFKSSGECVCMTEKKDGGACPMKQEMNKEMKMEHKCPSMQEMKK